MDFILGVIVGVIVNFLLHWGISVMLGGGFRKWRDDNQFDDKFDR